MSTSEGELKKRLDYHLKVKQNVGFSENQKVTIDVALVKKMLDEARREFPHKAYFDGEGMTQASDETYQKWFLKWFGSEKEAPK